MIIDDKIDHSGIEFYNENFKQNLKSLLKEMANNGNYNF